MATERVSRLFEVKRSENFIMYYPFTTWSCIWKGSEDPVLSKLSKFFQELILDGKPEDDVERKSISTAPKLMIDIEQVTGHDLVRLAQDADYQQTGKYGKALMPVVKQFVELNKKFAKEKE